MHFKGENVAEKGRTKEDGIRFSKNFKEAFPSKPREKWEDGTDIFGIRRYGSEGLIAVDMKSVVKVEVDGETRYKHGDRKSKRNKAPYMRIRDPSTEFEVHRVRKDMNHDTFTEGGYRSLP